MNKWEIGFPLEPIVRDERMRLYKRGVRDFQIRSFIVSVLIAVFIVGCVSVQQDDSNRAFMFTNNRNNAYLIDQDMMARQQWQGGDIVYAANGYIDHMAMIDDNTYGINNTPDIIDTDTNGSIRRHNDPDRWAEQGGWTSVEGYYVAVIEPSSGKSSKRKKTFNVGNAFNAQAEITLSPKLYKRNTPSNAHSSQLVRDAYKYIYNIDLAPSAESDWWSFPKDVLNNSQLIAISEESVVRS
jgi:hypothetical protein